MIYFELPIRIIAIVLLGGRFIYWTIQERRANTEKPKKYGNQIGVLGKRLVITLLNLLLYFQLFGLQIVPYERSFANLVLGLMFIILATLVSILARRELGHNWAHAAEYQIKNQHLLVTTGIYEYIRHPIYLGVILTFLGVQFIVGSYLVLLFMILIPVLALIQAKKEERILVEHFGQEYIDYQKRSYLFLPYVL